MLSIPLPTPKVPYPYWDPNVIIYRNLEESNKTIYVTFFKICALSCVLELKAIVDARARIIFVKSDREGAKSVFFCNFQVLYLISWNVLFRHRSYSKLWGFNLNCSREMHIKFRSRPGEVFPRSSYHISYISKYTDPWIS